MARYIAIIGFNSAVNAAQFSFNNPTLSPQNVEVTQGFTPPSGRLGQVAPGVSTPTTWVMVTSDSLNQLITVTQARPTSITFDTQTNQIVNNTNNIDPNSITVTQNQQDIFKNGILQTAPTQQPVPAVPQSLQDQITQFNLQTQNLLDQLTQYLTPPTPIVPVLPNSLQDQITKNQLIQQNLNDQLNLYFNPPKGAPIPAVPQSFQDQVRQFNLQTQNLMDQLDQFFTPPTDTPIPFQPIYDNPDLRKMLQRQKFVVPPDSQDQPPDVPIDPNLPPMPPPIEVPTIPYPPGFMPEPDTPQFDPSQPAEMILPHGWPPRGLFDDPKILLPTPESPGDYEIPPSQLNPFPKTPKILPLSDDGGGGLGPSIWGCVSGGQPLIVVLDDSCTVYTSSDGANTFCSAGTPAATIADDWSDMAIPVNDSASPAPNVVALWDFTVAASYDSTQFDGNRGGVQVISPSLGSAATALIRNYSPGTVGVNYRRCYSGAISSNGTILACPIAGDAFTFPRISTNFGRTWSDVTGLPSGSRWTRACFSKNATTMYIGQYQGVTYKSTNSGSTWSSLTASGSPTTWGGNGENKARFLCSPDGTIFAGIDLEIAFFFLTTNGGTTWTGFDMTTFSINGRSSIDLAMSSNGSKFLIVVGFPTTSRVFSSSNGTVWTEITSSVTPPANAPVCCCAFTPDGSQAVIFFQNIGANIQFSRSADGGVTWKSGTFPFVTSGVPSAAYMLPAGSFIH